MRSLSTTESSSAPTATASPTAAQRSPWHSPVPYLFGGLAAMLCLIAFALLILACSYWKLSGQLQNEEGGDGDSESGGDSEGGSAKNESVKVYEEKILVIMAGEERPTFLATPACAKSSSFGDGIGNHFGKDEGNREACDKSEKALGSHVPATTPRPQESQQQSQRQ